jgi:shikimate dehydrogenase
MRKFGLIGYPLGHSFSKKYFAEKFLNEGIVDCMYENYPLKNLEGFLPLLAGDYEISGLNITIPYKSEILRFLDILEPEASKIGAVNVVKIRRSGKSMKLYGYNSDVTGIRDTILPFITEDITTAIVFGTGGASRAVCHVLEKSGIKINLVSRERKQGVLVYSDLDSRIIDEAQLIINTTPLGMFPDTGSMPDIDYTRLTRNHILFDLVYNPEITSFLRMGMARGCRVLSGLKMLHSQAEKSWEIWNSDNL